MQTRNSLKKFQQTADLVDSKELLYSHLQAREAVLQVLQVADPPLLRLPGVHHDHLGAGRCRSPWKRLQDPQENMEFVTNAQILSM